jgi:hypothetical protein
MFMKEIDFEKTVMFALFGFTTVGVAYSMWKLSSITRTVTEILTVLN